MQALRIVRHVTHLLSATALLLVASAAPAATAQPASPPAPDPQADGPAPIVNAPAKEAPRAAHAPTARPKAASALARDLAQAKAEFQQQLARLTADFEQATDPTQALELQRQIADLKLQAEIGTLEIQARHARLQGHIELAEQADTILAAVREAGGKRCAPTPQVAPSAPQNSARR